ncbi:MAG: cysteine synthase A [Christensenellales bacterium]|jgi:cysteine synthase A
MLTDNIQNLIGNTPLIKLRDSNIYAKLECFNPLGSVKDRAALNMILEAEKAGILKKGGYIIEPTSGNTGIALACIGRQRGYRVILTMPENMSVERIKILRLLGAEVVLTSKSSGMGGCIDKARELAKENPNSFIPMQFENKANMEAHKITAKEIIKDLGDVVPDFLVAVVGSGGTIMGLTKYLKKKYPKMKVVAVEPEESRVLSGGKPSTHGIQGIGANFIPALVDVKKFDKIIGVSTSDAIEGMKMANKDYGVFVGISSGAALMASLRMAKENKNANIVTVFPDTGERYLSAFDINCNYCI